MILQTPLAVLPAQLTPGVEGSRSPGMDPLCHSERTGQPEALALVPLVQPGGLIPYHFLLSRW